MTTLLFLLALAILVLGPKKSLALSRTAGVWYRKAQQAKDELYGQLNSELQGVAEPVHTIQPPADASPVTATDQSRVSEAA